MSERCNSEVVDEDDIPTPFSRNESRKVINVLNASNTYQSRQSQSFVSSKPDLINMNNFSSFQV